MRNFRVSKNRQGYVKLVKGRVSNMSNRLEIDTEDHNVLASASCVLDTRLWPQDAENLKEYDNEDVTFLMDHFAPLRMTLIQ